MKRVAKTVAQYYMSFGKEQYEQDFSNCRMVG
jgi:hypothetical protein